MAYAGPTFLPTDELAKMHTRRFDEMTAGTPLPSDPLHARVEGDKFAAMLEKTTLPSDQARTHLETSRFESLIADTPSPSQQFLEANATPEPAASSPAPPVTAAPEGSPSSGASGDDPIARTLAFLRGIGPGGNSTGDRPPSEFETPPAPAEAPPASTGDLGPLGGPGGSQTTPPAGFAPIGAAPPRPGAAPLHAPTALDGPDPAGLTRPVIDAVKPAADAASGMLIDQIDRTNQAQAETDARASAIVGKYGRGEPISSDEMARSMEDAANVGMVMSGEPLANAGGKVAGKVAEGLLDAAGRPIRAVAGDVTSILGPAGEVLKDVRTRAPKVEIPYPEFLQPEAKMAKTDVPLYRQVFDRTRNVIGSMGEAGQDLANRVHAWREGAEVDAQGFIDRMPTVDKLGPASFTNMVDVLEGKAKPLNATIEQAATEARGVLDDVFSRADNAGVKVADRMGNYFPHRYKDAIVDQIRDVKKRGELIRHLMDSGQAGTEDEAVAQLSRFGTASKDRRQGSLEMERLANLPGYEKTKEALYNHVLSASRRIHEVAQFGRDDAIKDRLVTQMGAEGYDSNLANDMFKTIVGASTYSEAAQKISRIGRTYHTATRLGLAALSNATQSVNTASVAGVLKTVQAMPKAIWSPEEKQFARSTGVTLDAIINEVREGGGWSDKITGKLMPGFNQVEGFNRRVAAIAGRDFAADMATKAAAGSTSAVRALEKLGLDAAAVAKRGALTAQEEIAAARSIVERTQFRVDAQDLPQWASHPMGKLVAQFKQFSYNQTAFVQRELIDEAKKGNVLPMVRFAILAPLAQAAATETRNVLSGRPPEEDPGMRMVQYALGPLGVGGDVARSFLGINSKYVPPATRAARLAGSLMGPSVGTGTELLTDAMAGLEGDPKPAVRTALRQIPVAGGYLANTLTPYKLPDAPASSRPGRDSGRSGRESGRSSGR